MHSKVWCLRELSKTLQNIQRGPFYVTFEVEMRERVCKLVSVCRCISQSIVVSTRCSMNRATIRSVAHHQHLHDSHF